ncbi:MAG: hypothetical protein ACU0A4_09420 [Paracoccaceae bacterium]
MISKKFQSVSIWWFPECFTVRGYYRGASHLIKKCVTLEEAVKVAFAADRKQLSVALIPATQELDHFAQKVATALTGDCT